MNGENKKKKVKHISEGDKARFLEIMKRYVSILECKKHDNNSIRKKRAAWDNLIVDYNAEASTPKSEVQLKILWKDLKAKAKKSVSKMKRERIKTGGGKNDPDLDENTKIITDMIPQVFESISHVGDDDASDDGLNDDEENTNSNIIFEQEDQSENSDLNTQEISQKKC